MTPRSRASAALAVGLCGLVGCGRPAPAPDHLTVAIAVSPNNLDPRVGSDEASQRVHNLVYNSLVNLDGSLHVVPELAERLDLVDPTTYRVTLRRGVRFHDGRELSADDVVYTFTTLVDPSFVSPRRGAYSLLDHVTAVDRWTVDFHLKTPFASFPINLVMGIVPAGATNLAAEPNGTGPYRVVRFQPDASVELIRHEAYFDTPARVEHLTLKVVPDNTMLALELLNRTADLVVNDLAPDLVDELRREPRLAVVTSPGIDYAYVGINLRDPVLSDVRVRRALALGIDRHAIVEHLRRGLAVESHGILPPQSWAALDHARPVSRDVEAARRLLDEAGWPDPDGRGPASRLTLTLKVSNAEFPRLQAAVLQAELREIGVALDVRTFEFSTLYADVLRGRFQLFALQWVGVSDPDMLRRVFHSSQMPPLGFNRGFYENPSVDALLDRAAATADEEARRELYAEVQRVLAVDTPYLDLWHKTNVVVARRELGGIDVPVTASFSFLKNVTWDATTDRTTTSSRHPASSQVGGPP
ncbi:MAG: ABC transporter substrate-binding protein [Vicinamibacterales bacterium]